MKVFDRIDEYFSSKDKKEFLYTTILSISLVGFIIYYFIYPVADEYKTTQEKNYHKLVQNIIKLKCLLSL
jgi:flagellar biosynthesis protein FlhB